MPNAIDFDLSPAIEAQRDELDADMNEILERVMKETGKKPRQIAAIMDVTDKWVYMLRSGFAHWSTESIARLAAATGRSLTIQEKPDEGARE